MLEMCATLLQNPISVKFFVDEVELVDAHEDELQAAGCFEEDPTCLDDELDEYN